MYSDILLTIENGIATITINRSQSLNSLTALTFQELRDAFENCSDNDEVRAVVVTGDGKTFSSGGDMGMFDEMLERGIDYEDSRLRALDAGKMAYAARQCKKPIIAMVNGACFGAGLSLALACDFRIIDQNTKMSTGFINAAFTGDTGSIFHLKEMLGYAKMTELMMLGPILNADEIFSLGLASKIAEEGQLSETTYKLAKKFANGPTSTYAKQKKLFWEVFFKDYDHYAELEAQYMAECTSTKDFREAISAFLEKRPPNFIGE